MVVDGRSKFKRFVSRIYAESHCCGSGSEAFVCGHCPASTGSRSFCSSRAAKIKYRNCRHCFFSAENCSHHLRNSCRNESAKAAFSEVRIDLIWRDIRIQYMYICLQNYLRFSFELQDGRISIREVLFEVWKSCQDENISLSERRVQNGGNHRVRGGFGCHCILEKEPCGMTRGFCKFSNLHDSLHAG